MGDEIKRLCSAERLVPFITEPPIDRGDPNTRTFLLSPSVNGALERGLARGIVRWESAGFDLTQYCEGEQVTVRRLGYDRDADIPAFFVFLEQRNEEPPDVWEVRFTTFRPQIRIFGSFYCRNRFVGLTWSNKDDVDYPEEMRGCVAAWVDVFGVTVFPYRGAFPDGYLSRTQLVP